MRCNDPSNCPSSSLRGYWIRLSRRPAATALDTSTALANGLTTSRRSSRYRPPLSSSAAHRPTAAMVHSRWCAGAISTAFGTATPSAKRSWAWPICSGTYTSTSVAPVCGSTVSRLTVLPWAMSASRARVAGSRKVLPTSAGSRSAMMAPPGESRRTWPAPSGRSLATRCCSAARPKSVVTTPRNLPSSRIGVLTVVISTFCPAIS